jgi:NTP pyrophosphatase (non-canonical NTP hydrolase)
MINLDILESIHRRINTARDLYGPLTSTHEGLGAALEEWDELLHAIHANDAGAIRREACDLAAICIRLAEACAMPAEPFARRSGFIKEIDL